MNNWFEQVAKHVKDEIFKVWAPLDVRVKHLEKYFQNDVERMYKPGGGVEWLIRKAIHEKVAAIEREFEALKQHLGVESVDIPAQDARVEMRFKNPGIKEAKNGG